MVIILLIKYNILQSMFCVWYEFGLSSFSLDVSLEQREWFFSEVYIFGEDSKNLWKLFRISF